MNLIAGAYSAMGDLPDPEVPSFVDMASILGLFAAGVVIIGGGIALGMLMKARKTKPQEQMQTTVSALIPIVFFMLIAGGAIFAVVLSTGDFFFN